MEASRRMRTDRQETIRGTLSKIRFQSDDGEFAVCELEPRDGDEPVTIVGNILSTQPGETVEVVGSWTVDAEYGRQFEIDGIRAVPPTTEEGIEKYLASGLVEGIGPVLAERIVDHFGDETLEILDAEPERIKEVDGIGEVRGERIIDAWTEQRAIRSVMVFLQSHGVGSARAIKIWREYGPDATRILQENPYRLAEDVHGIGFKTADRIARNMGIDEDAPERLAAGLLHELSEAGREGHMFLPREELFGRAAESLAVERDRLRGLLERLEARDEVVVESVGEDRAAVYRSGSHGAECGAADHVRKLLRGDRFLADAADGPEIERPLAEVEGELGFELADKQREAVAAAWRDPVVVITGGPGTGKTTIVEAVCELGDRLGETVALAAPTGRAAKRLGEATGRRAQTIHRLLEFSFEEGGFQYDEDRPLDVDMLIVDEASMLDTSLFHSVVRALPASASLLLVGDIDQLPSVGPGDVLSDLIDSGRVNVVELTEIFRQDERSTIVVNAHRINRGEMPVVPKRDRGELVDFYTISADSAGEARERIVRAVSSRIPEAFDYDPVREVQILSPMHRGEVGCDRLNDELQERFHGADEEGVERFSQTWKVGDRVMQTQNNYDLEVFNGDIGTVRRIDDFSEVLTVDYDGRDVEYPFDALDQLSLAYAITVHKSQGNEYPAVVIPVVTEHYIMLQRNLLYTAVTRARDLVVLVGSKEAVRIAVDNDDADHRYTRLDARVRSG